MTPRARALLALIAAILVAGCSRQSADAGDGGSPARELVVYCAAGLKPPVEAVAREYQEATGVTVQLQYGGSGTLLSNLRVAGKGDLFIAADESYIRAAREFGLIEEVLPLARQRPVIVVRKGNPHGVRGLEDLWTRNLRVELANPEAAAIGRTVRETLTRTGQWPLLEARVTVFKPTVNEAANDVKLGAVDAAIVWDSTAGQYPELESIRVPVFEDQVETVSVAVLRTARDPAGALRFARFLAAPERGGKAFAARHFEPVPGDPWVAEPELRLFSGAMLRPGIEQTLREFEQREGCRITTVYNGCGVLVAQMRTGQRPDAYFSCDTSFMTQVADLYADPVDVSENRVVLIVPKGNPKGITTLADLSRPGLRVGLPHREKSAMGAIILRILQDTGVYEKLGDNLKVESPTGDFLVNQLRTGSLDVIVACRSNQIASADHLDAVPVEHPLASMVQPYAVGREASHPHLAARLLDRLTTPTSKERFVQAGFGWRHAD